MAKNLAHLILSSNLWFEFTTDGMQKFDYGTEGNRQRYGSPLPPRYPVSAVTCPTALYWTQNDHLSAPEVTRVILQIKTRLFIDELIYWLDFII